MEAIRSSFRNWAIIGGLIVSLNFVHAQALIKKGQFNSKTSLLSADSIVGVVAEARGLQLVPSGEAPLFGTFWLVSSSARGGNIAPLPCPPLDPSLPIYAITDVQFLVDGTTNIGCTDAVVLQAQAEAVDNLIADIQTAAVNRQMQAMAGNMTALAVPTPSEGSGNGGTTSFTMDFGYTSVDYGTNLWLEVTNIENNCVNGLLHNSSPLVPYALLSKQTPTFPAWNPAATLYGSVITTNVTPFSVPMLARGSLLLRARSQFAPGIIGAGISHDAVIRRDGTVWAWGANNNGQLGNGQWVASNIPAQVTGLSNIVIVVTPASGGFTLALDADGTVWSWGAGGSGQLGRADGNCVDANLAAQVPGLSNIVAIAAGAGHSLALKSDGTVWAWGDNSIGQLGNGTNISRDYSAPVPGLTNAISIFSGAYHSFALCVDGRVWGWGYNGDGELGLGNTTDQPQPVLVNTLTNVVALSAGYSHSIALLSDGTVRSCGWNYCGQLGNGTYSDSSTPVIVSGLSNVIAIAGGGYHNLALHTNGALSVWGYGGSGQLGDGSGNNAPTSFLLTNVSNVTAIAGGGSSSMISTVDGSIYVWGGTPSLVDLYANYSSDGSGLPDWWELFYFGHLGLDPNADPDGDGWSNWQEFQKGTNPTNFNTPPTPSGLVVTQNIGQTDITLTWNAISPSPSNYIITRYDFNPDTLNYVGQQIGEVAGNVNTFVDNGSISGGDANSIYEIQALYTGGSSPLSAQAYVNSTAPASLNYNLPISAQLIRNATGRWQLMFLRIPANVQTIRLYWYSNGVENTIEDITTNSITNGIYPISDAEVINYLGNTLYVEGLSTNLLPAQLYYVGVMSDDAPYFVDGRRHMKQNLSFLIRGASLSHPFGVYLSPRFNQTATNFEEFSFLCHDWPYGYGWNFSHVALNDLWPFMANDYLANYFVDVTRINAGQSPYGTNDFIFQLNFTTNVPAPAVLTHSDPYWILQPHFNLPIAGNPPFDACTGSTNWGVTLMNFTNNSLFAGFLSASLQSGLYNLFGLPEQTGCAIDANLAPYYWNGSWTTTYSCIYQPLEPGYSVTTEQASNHVIEFYASWCPAPTLNFVNYYFAPLINTNGDTMNLPAVMQQPCPLPIDDYFAVTNQTPTVMFGSVGQPMILGAWAKYSIQGSSPTKYAYLGQYFVTNAFKVDTNGVVTANTTGIVSPYGEFFPTEPGPVAMITMPDIDTGQQATGVVQVISLALDANHDGTIDTAFNGPDSMSANHPYRFWVNNDYDRGHTVDGSDFEQDDVSSDDSAAESPYTGVSTPDYDYRNVSGNRIIPCTRDLEDFARLWVCGITSNLQAMLPANSTVTLSWGDVGNPNPNNPTIDLFTAADANGGISYLTNATVAATQIDPVQFPYIRRLAPGGSIQLNTNYFGNTWRGNHFIWCGVSNGTGGLTLTIADVHSNVLAQTKTYIQLVDIKQMYERWAVGDNPSIAPINMAQIATNDLPTGVSRPFRFANPGNLTTPYILYVHGWNMETWEKDRYAETAFKRLYWQGYQGRFGVFRWPTGNNFSGIISGILDSRNYDNSEFNAWLSASGLLNKLAGLNSQYPGHVYLMAHSMGNVVAGEALRLTGTNQLVNTYVAMQGAVPAHCYDASTANRTTYNPPDCYAHYWTNGASCYFNGSAGAGTYVNFYNTNDYALSWYNVGQNWKPDSGLASPGYYYDTPSGLHPSGFYKIFGSIDQELYFPTDTCEIFAYADPVWSFALGAQADVGGAFTKASQVNLQSVWPIDTHPQLHGPYSAHAWHSAQFRSDYPSRSIFWNTAISKMRLPL